MKKLSAGCGRRLPLGAGSGVDAVARELASDIGIEALSGYVKVHFKNYLKLK
jgi:ribonuclease HIII